MLRIKSFLSVSMVFCDYRRAGHSGWQSREGFLRDIEMVLCMAQSAQVYVYEMDPTAVTADDLYNTIASPSRRSSLLSN